jgi:hypothetical protein
LIDQVPIADAIPTRALANLHQQVLRRDEGMTMDPTLVLLPEYLPEPIPAMVLLLVLVPQLRLILFLSLTISCEKERMEMILVLAPSCWLVL